LTSVEDLTNFLPVILKQFLCWNI